MIQSLDEMAENTLRMMDGETVVSIDPKLLDGSFVADRIGENDEEYSGLREAISRSGQSTPILIRPHPDTTGRYMIVFGHRRAKVAMDLGINVRAVIRSLADIEHVIAQGQENTARADLSFIEKALFARKLINSGMTKDTVKSALTIDDTLLSRMLSVADTVPETVLSAVGAAKGVGRDRWEELKKLVQVPVNAERANQFVASEAFGSMQTDEGFNLLLNHLKTAKKLKKASPVSKTKAWAPNDRSVNVKLQNNGKTATIALSAANGSRFAEFITDRLDDLYQAFLKSGDNGTGD
jgi:ParB family chromosome partitioning protein